MRKSVNCGLHGYRVIPISIKVNKSEILNIGLFSLHICPFYFQYASLTEVQ